MRSLFYSDCGASATGNRAAGTRSMRHSRDSVERQSLLVRLRGNETSAILCVVLLGMLTQALWLYLVPFEWGSDTTPNLAIGRMYFGLPYEMWSIKNYYPPGYAIFLTLLGVHHLDTLAIVRVGTLLVGGLMPLLLYLMLRRVDRAAALLAALILAASFGHALFSTDMMNHHFHAFLLLVMSAAIARHLYRPDFLSAVLLGCAAAVADTGRDVTLFVFAGAVFILLIAGWAEHRTFRAPLKNAMAMVISFAALIGGMSVLRQVALGEPFRFGLTYDIGARALLQGAYYGASIYQKEFHPGDDFVFVKPDNGPASQEFFALMRRYLEIPHVKTAGLSDTNDPDEAVRNAIANPNVRNTYIFWWGIESFKTPAEGDALWRKVVIETIVAQPRILRYYAWNFWSYLFGPPLVNVGNCLTCVCPPCFASSMPAPSGAAFTGGPFFSKVAGPGLIAEMEKEHERGQALAPYARYLYADADLIFLAKPVLMILLFASPFLARGRTRFVMLYCVAAVLIIGATTSLAWPVQARYQYPAIPYLLAGAAISAIELVRWIAGLAAASSLRRESASGPRPFS